MHVNITQIFTLGKPYGRAVRVPVRFIPETPTPIGKCQYLGMYDGDYVVTVWCPPIPDNDYWGSASYFLRKAAPKVNWLCPLTMRQPGGLVGYVPKGIDIPTGTHEASVMTIVPPDKKRRNAIIAIRVHGEK